MFGRTGLQYYPALVWTAFNFTLVQKFLKFEVQFIIQVFTFTFVNFKFQISRILE